MAQHTITFLGKHPILAPTKRNKEWIERHEGITAKVASLLKLFYDHDNSDLKHYEDLVSQMDHFEILAKVTEMQAEVVGGDGFRKIIEVNSLQGEIKKLSDMTQELAEKGELSIAASPKELIRVKTNHSECSSDSTLKNNQ